MTKFAVLMFTVASITLGRAQTPPMPPLPNFIVAQPTKVKKQITYTALCVHCMTKYSNLIPKSITTNGAVTTNGGFIVQRTMIFGCPSRDCLEDFTSKNTVFVPESVAVEDEPISAPVQIKSMLQQTPTPTWTTNVNLKLSIEYLNRTNQFRITSPSPGSVVSNTINISTSPIPTVAIRFPTELGKSYQCQATDNCNSSNSCGQNWLNGPVIAGTGHSVTNYEFSVKMARLYRVLEMNQ